MRTFLLLREQLLGDNNPIVGDIDWALLKGLDPQRSYVSAEHPSAVSTRTQRLCTPTPSAKATFRNSPSRLQYPVRVILSLLVLPPQVRSAFESNVVCSFDTQEAIFDHAFDRLSLGGGQVWVLPHDCRITAKTHGGTSPPTQVFLLPSPASAG